LHNYIKPAIMSYRRVTPVKTGAVSSIISQFLDSGFHRNECAWEQARFRR